MNNKTYPFIVINKNNMTKLEHFKSAYLCSLSLSHEAFNPGHWIVIKNERTIVDLSGIKIVSNCPMSESKRKIQEALEKA